MPEDIDTSNDFLVGSNGLRIVPTLPIRAMDKEQALRLAAWLVVLADPPQERFPLILKAVMNT
jgi:hypothetical protein